MGTLVIALVLVLAVALLVALAKLIVWLGVLAGGALAALIALRRLAEWHDRPRRPMSTTI